MGTEIERKFLVEGEFKKYAIKFIKISQGYLSSDPERSVRIRITDLESFITIKGKSNKSGTSRFEWEKQINTSEAKELLKLCLPDIVVKTRHHIKSEKHLFEVDEFHEKNKGLIVAEIELSSENEEFVKPDWLGKEVTGDKKYYNAQLAITPYSKWKKNS